MTTNSPVIVCVDDNAAMLTTMVRVLAPLRCEILSSTEPAVALDWIAKREVAVIVADFEMPAMNGVELMMAAREIRPEAIRILLTGMRTSDVVTASVGRGEIFRYLAKPFEPAALREIVTSALAKNREHVA